MEKTIDIHNMTREEAKKLLEKMITTAATGTNIRVIHGYHGGNVLSNMVRQNLKHKRIKQKILTMNFGETILVIK